MNVVALKETAPLSLDALRDAMPDYAKDIRLNLGSILTPEGAPELSENQIFQIALASTYATRNTVLVGAILQHASALSNIEIEAAKAAASIMGMNNVYYRFVHLVGDAQFKTMPAKLRMNVIAQSGVSKLDFELMSLAVSAINGCGMCIEAHTHELMKHGSNALQIQSAVRIAAVIAATAQVLAIG